MNELFRVCNARRASHFIHLDRPAVGDVVGNTRVEEQTFLRHHPKMLPIAFLSVVADIETVVGHDSGGGIVEAQ